VPPLGNYSLCIAPAAARATPNKTIMTNAPTLLAISLAMVVRGALVQYQAYCLMEEVHGFLKSH